jgi:hydroxymethylbilane synthase
VSGVNRPPAGDATTRLRLGTRGSALALAQSAIIATALRSVGAAVEVVTIRTAGDGRAPDTVWGEGAFVTALEEGLLDGRIDVAVHSAKDVPIAQDPRLRIAAYPVREDPRDALVARDPRATLATLPPGARVGTDSPRRVAFLLAYRSDLRPHPLHGNVDTRLRRLAEGETDALVLAVAGLARLGLAERISQVLPAEVLPPAPGQGALAIQCRADDASTRSLVERLDDPATRAAVEAERAVLAASGGGCRAPLGALGRVDGRRIVLVAGAADPAAVPEGDAPARHVVQAPGSVFTAARDGVAPVRVAWARRSGAVADAAALAADLAAELATVLRRPAEPGSPGARGPRVLVTRDATHAGQLLDALRDRGLDPVHVPTIAIETSPPGGPLDEVVANLEGYAWVVVTSANGAEALGAASRRRGIDLASARLAAVGDATADAIRRAGGTAHHRPVTPTAAGLAGQLPIAPGDRVLVVRGDLADGRLAEVIRSRGATVDEVVAYRTVEAPGGSAGAIGDAVRGGLGAIAFTSGSTVRGLLALLDGPVRDAALDIPACCIGPSTSAVARGLGFSTVLEADRPDAASLAELVRTGIAAGFAPSRLPAISREAS